MLTLIISRMKKKNKRMARHKEKRRQKRGVRRTSADGKRDEKASDVRGEANGTGGVLDVGCYVPIRNVLYWLTCD